MDVCARDSGLVKWFGRTTAPAPSFAVKGAVRGRRPGWRIDCGDQLAQSPGIGPRISVSAVHAVSKPCFGSRPGNIFPARWNGMHYFGDSW